MTDAFLPAESAPDWLDDIEGDRALAWAGQWSDDTVAALPREDSERLEADLLAIYDSDDRIPVPCRRGDHLYNYWRDADHPRGLWRRTTLESFAAGAPGAGGETEWETLIDLDALAAEEDENWVWGGAAVRYPDYDRALIHLSRGGADATVVREFDMATLTFVEDGFTIAEAKTSASWLGRNELLVGTALGRESLTDSGYPREVRRWRRGTELADAPILFAGHRNDVAVHGWFSPAEGHERINVERSLDFYRSHRFVDIAGPASGTPIPDRVELQILEIPDDCIASIHHEWLLLRPRTDFNGIPAGGLAVAELEGWLRGERDVVTLFEPDAHTALGGMAWTRNHLILHLLRDVTAVLETRSIGDWVPGTIRGLPGDATVSVVGTSPERDDEVWLSVTSALQPSSLLHAPDLGALIDGTAAPELLRQAPARFDADGMETRQHWAVSVDGTRIPYRITGRFTGSAQPTLVHAYGGFEVSLVPSYNGVLGHAWLARGGLAVQANLRGGGEFGPRWHSDVVRRNRPKVYEDHQAVLADVIDRGYATPAMLAVQGGSNGGLLTAVALTSYPELMGAVVSQVPLTDMLRYHRLSAGASWMAEYGDPDDEGDRAVIETYSPVQRVAPREAREYPPALVTTSTRDDRVHPAHARTLAWLLREAGQPVSYWENIEGGHGGAADNKQAAFAGALIYTWLWEQLKNITIT